MNTTSPSPTLEEARDHFQAGRMPDALRAYRQIVKDHPELAIAHHELARTCKAMGRREETFAALRRAIELSPDFIPAIFDLGVALRETGRQDEALSQFRRLLELNPDHAAAHGNMGHALADLGRFDETEGHFRKAIELKDDYGEAWRGLANLGRLDPSDNSFSVLEAKFASDATADEDRLQMGFGLAKFHEDQARYDDAFSCLSIANRLKRNNIVFDLSKTKALVESILKAFDASLLQQHAGSGSDDSTPIFVLGMPRSGSTLVEQILACHPTVHGAGEQPYVEVVISNAINVHDIAFPGGLAEASGEQFNTLAEDYLARLRSHDAASERITDKMLGNFMLIGFIHLILPNAKIIHVYRHPMDTCFSIYSRLFHRTHLYAYDLEELASMYGLYRSLMDHWRTVLPGRMMDLAYEDLIADQEGKTRELLDYCGLPFHEDCLTPHRKKRAILTASNVQVRQPVNDSSIGRWRRFEEHLDPLCQLLGDYLTEA